MKPHAASSAALDIPACSPQGERIGTLSPAPRLVPNPWTPLGIGLAIALFVWVCGYKPSHSIPHPGATSHVFIGPVWDKHQDVTHAAAAIRSIGRRAPNPQTAICVPTSTLRLPQAGLSPAGERWTLALPPHLSLVRPRAPPLPA